MVVSEIYSQMEGGGTLPFLNRMLAILFLGISHETFIQFNNSGFEESTEILCFFSLILKEIGGSADRKLQHLSGSFATAITSRHDKPLMDFDKFVVECEKHINGVKLLDDRLYEAIQDLVSSNWVEDVGISPEFWQELSRMTTLEELELDIRRESWVSALLLCSLQGFLNVFSVSYVVTFTNT